MYLFNLSISIVIIIASFNIQSIHSLTENFRGENFDKEWNIFKNFREKFNRKYNTIDEIKSRFNIFRNNLKTINEHNNENKKFTLGINKFADLTNEEYSNLKGLKKEGLFKHCNSYRADTISELSESIDWTDKLGPILDQGQCGSCYAFSSIQQIQSSYAIKYGKILDLSEEQVVECSQRNAGCNGGNIDAVFTFAMTTPLCLEEEYPYVSENGETSSCETKCKGVVTVNSCYDIEENNQQDLKNALYKQPVSVAIDASTPYFQLYNGGIIDSNKCGTDLDHAVFLIGYGTENGTDYWLLRNSWSESWGDNGTFKILRTNSTNDAGICGIAMMASFSIVN
jgi:C1A family cysteine protease